MIIKNIKVALVAAGLCLSMVACDGANYREDNGTLIGALGGGLIGSQFGHGGGRLIGGAVGALAGGLVGNRIGHDMDVRDHRESRIAFNRASRAPVGETVYWHGSDNHWGSYQVIREGRSRRYNHHCREFSSLVSIDGRAERVYGTACRKPDGSWYHYDERF